MKVVYLVHQFLPEYHTGTEKFVYHLASMSQKTGNNVKVITYSCYDTAAYDRRIGAMYCRDFHYNGIPVLALRHAKVPADAHYSLDNPELAVVARDILDKEAPDIVHVGHAMRVSELVKELPATGIPYMMTLTDYFLICPKVNLSATRAVLCSGPQNLESCAKLCPELDNGFLRRRREAAEMILRGSRKLVAPSRFLAGMYENELPELDVQVIPHGMAFENLGKNTRTYDAESPVVFCYAGSLNPHKGVHLVIEAFAALANRNIRLKIYGHGMNEVYINDLKAKAAGDARIEFCGSYAPNDIGAIFSAVDVMVIPSICFESYSFTLHEAFACNVPVIVANLGALAEKVTDGKNGLSFEPGNAASLGEAMQRVAHNPAVLNEFKNSLKFMHVQTIEQEACAYERAYRQLLYQH